MKNNINKIFWSSVLGSSLIIFFVTFQMVFAAWISPSVNPPLGNEGSGLINLSSTHQSKVGGIGVGGNNADNYARFSYATSQDVIRKALERIKLAVEE